MRASVVELSKNQFTDIFLTRKWIRHSKRQQDFCRPVIQSSFFVSLYIALKFLSKLMFHIWLNVFHHATQSHSRRAAVELLQSRRGHTSDAASGGTSGAASDQTTVRVEKKVKICAIQKMLSLSISLAS